MSAVAEAAAAIRAGGLVVLPTDTVYGLACSPYRPAPVRALSAFALAAVRPLAPGFGLEVGMTIDAIRSEGATVTVRDPDVAQRTRRRDRKRVRRDRERAIAFERYLKTASGRAFAKKRL